MSQSKPVCEQCGVPANVHISNVVAGVPTMRHFCQDCVDDADIDMPNPRRRWGGAAVLGSVGFIVLFLSLFADRLGLGDNPGFGWHQEAGLVVGGVVLLLGAVARAPTLLIIGMMICGLAILADWLAFGEAEGFGRQQIRGTVLGVALIITALVVSRSKS